MSARAPVLATVPMVPLLRKAPSPVLVSVSAPTSQPAEAYRSLRTSLQFARHDRPLRTLLVTSPSAGEGKTTVVVNLGAVFAQAGARVVLVSCDLRRPGLSQFIAPGEHAELRSVLAGEQPLERAVTPVPGVDGLWTLGARDDRGEPHRAARRPADAGRRRPSCRGAFDLVLIDSPPVLPVADALILSSYVDAVLLVVASGQTRRGELRRTMEKLAQAGAPVVGAVLNKASAQQGYGYYGGYQPYVLPGMPRTRRHGTGGASRTVPRCHPGSPDGVTTEAPDVSGDGSCGRSRRAAGWCSPPSRLTIALLRRLAVLDMPGGRSSHSVPTPRGGGAPIAVGLIAAVLIAPGAGDARPALAAAIGFFGLLGLLDDLRGLPALSRLLLQAAGAAVVAAVLAVAACGCRLISLAIVSRRWRSGWSASSTPSTSWTA